MSKNEMLEKKHLAILHAGGKLSYVPLDTVTWLEVTIDEYSDLNHNGPIIIVTTPHKEYHHYGKTIHLRDHDKYHKSIFTDTLIKFMYQSQRRDDESILHDEIIALFNKYGSDFELTEKSTHSLRVYPNEKERRKDQDEKVRD